MAKMLDSLTAHEIECALIAAAIRDPSVFVIDLDAADFSHEGLQSFWRTGQALVVGDRADEKPLFQAPLRQLGQENVLLGIEVVRRRGCETRGGTRSPGAHFGDEAASVQGLDDGELLSGRLDVELDLEPLEDLPALGTAIVGSGPVAQ